MTEAEIQRACASMVHREVYCCASSLVYQLAQNYGLVSHVDQHGKSTDLAGIIEQAFELSCPIDDWEEAAIQAGYHFLKGGDWTRACENTEDIPPYWDSAEDCCRENNIDPYQWEVFEHWIVSQWLGEKLQERGEKVDFDFCNLVIWARTTTGQAISMDNVIREILQSTQKGERNV